MISWIRPVGCSTYHLFDEKKDENTYSQLCGGNLTIDGREKRDHKNEQNPKYCHVCKKYEVDPLVGRSAQLGGKIIE